MGIDYPDWFIRGIKSETMVNENDQVKSEFLVFSLKDARPDGWVQESINWEDDKDVLSFTLNLTKTTGEVRFRGGAVRIQSQHVQNLTKMQRVQGRFTYERSKTPENPYHGNLLLHGDAPSHIRRMIVGTLVLYAEKVIRQ